MSLGTTVILYLLIGIGVAVEAFDVRNLNAAQDELSSRNQLMHVIPDAHIIHGAGL